MIAAVAQRSSDAGNRRDPDVANAIAGTRAPSGSKSSGWPVDGSSWRRRAIVGANAKSEWAVGGRPFGRSKNRTGPQPRATRPSKSDGEAALYPGRDPNARPANAPPTPCSKRRCGAHRIMDHTCSRADPPSPLAIAADVGRVRVMRCQRRCPALLNSPQRPPSGRKPTRPLDKHQAISDHAVDTWPVVFWGRAESVQHARQTPRRWAQSERVRLLSIVAVFEAISISGLRSSGRSCSATVIDAPRSGTVIS